MLTRRIYGFGRTQGIHELAA